MSNTEAIWDAYRASVRALEEYESQTIGRKKEMILSLRDSVAELVARNMLHIKQSEISAYVRNALIDRGITVGSGYFLSLFNDDQKRKYSKSSQGSFGHEHAWDIVLQRGTQKWESCECGVNRLNGMIQESIQEDPNEIIRAPLSEVTYPDEPEFQIIDKLLAISQNNVLGLRRLKAKTAVHKSVLKKQAKKCVEITYKEKLANEIKQVEARQNIVKKEVNKLGKPKEVLAKLNGIITQQTRALRYFNGRVSLLNYEKVMARFAVFCGWDKSDIANFLGITTKHMKVNILQNHTRESILTELDWFSRCPNPDCGIVLKDYFEDKLEEYDKTDKVSIADENYDMEMLRPTGYQAQVLSLQKQLKRLRKTST